MIDTLLALDHFREIVGYDPWFFWQLAETSIHPPTAACKQVLRETTWQDAERVGREQIRQAIAQAEARLAEALGFNPAPRYEEHLLQWPKLSNRAAQRIANVEAPWHRVGLQLPRGYVRKIGYQRRTAIDIAATVTFADLDGDGLDETFTLSVPTTLSDPDEIAVYFAAAERWDGSAVGEDWRVRPVNVTLNGVTAEITGRAWTIVRPVLYQGVLADRIDPTAVANFPTVLEVHRLWYDQDGVDESNSQAVLYWETSPCHGWWCCCAGCTTVPASSFLDPGAEARAVARAGIRNAELGIVTAGQALLDAATGIWAETPWSLCKEPDRVRVRALTGYARESGEMARRMRTLVARMAMAELTERPTGCAQADKELYRWQFDLARTAGANDEMYGVISPEDLANPFGTRRGHVYAWKEVKDLMRYRGISGT